MDLECTIAAANGIKYWAFDSYQASSGNAGHNDSLSTAWNMYQASPNNNLVKWCWIMGGSMLGAPTWSDNSWQPYMTTLAQQMAQSNYMTVLSGRPLLYVIWDDSYVTSWFQGSNANFATTLTYLRTQCSNQGIGNPYIVLISLGVSTTTISSRRATVGADAISQYAPIMFSEYTGSLPNAWSLADTRIQAQWAAMVATGSPVIPCAMTGWDKRPRIDHPDVVGGTVAPPFIGHNLYYVTPTNTEVANHMQALVNYVNANPSACPSGAALIYSWNECSEGGNGLIPTLGRPPSNNTTSLLSAIAPVIS
jgi:hypothetical protein